MKALIRLQGYRIILALAALSSSALVLEAGHRWK